MVPEVELDIPQGGGDPSAGGGDDRVTAELAGVLARFAALVDVDGSSSDADLVDQIRLLEQLKCAAGAVQHARIAEFARLQVEHQLASGVPAARVGSGIAAQIGLACRASAHEGARRLSVARALRQLPAVAAAFRAGDVAEATVRSIDGETSHLDPGQRAAIDPALAEGLAEMSWREATGRARRLAYAADPAGTVSRGRTARQHRRVSLRPKPDTMAQLSALLPVEQGVACLAALRAEADRVCGVGSEARSRDQVMADTLVERLTGQAKAEQVAAEVAVLIPVDSLLDPDGPEPGDLVGHGPLPADLVRDLLNQPHGRIWWRRLFTAPKGATTGAGCSGPIVGGDPTRRRFDGWLAKLIRYRDRTCRDPYCDAQIRHFDHIHRFADGGPTTYPNGRGVCVRGNQVRELPGWHVEVIHGGLDGLPHTIRITTPTGHTYRSRAPDPP